MVDHHMMQPYQQQQEDVQQITNHSTKFSPNFSCIFRKINYCLKYLSLLLCSNNPDRHLRCILMSKEKYIIHAISVYTRISRKIDNVFWVHYRFMALLRKSSNILYIRSVSNYKSLRKKNLSFYNINGTLVQKIVKKFNI